MPTGLWASVTFTLKRFTARPPRRNNCNSGILPGPAGSCSSRCVNAPGSASQPRSASNAASRTQIINLITTMLALLAFIVTILLYALLIAFKMIPDSTHIAFITLIILEILLIVRQVATVSYSKRNLDPSPRPSAVAINTDPVMVQSTCWDGEDNVSTTSPPPAYGLLKGSKRVDPNRFFWVKREEVSTQQESGSLPLEEPRLPPPYHSGD